MASPFFQTLRSLEADGGRAWALGMAGVTVLLLAWGAWFLGARVPVYATSTEARLEAGSKPHRVEAPVDARVTAIHVVLDQEIAEGELLVTLDRRTEHLEIGEAEARRGAFEEELAALERRLASEQQALREAVRSAAAAGREAQARLEEAQARARLARSESQRFARLHEEGVAPEAELQRTAAEAEQLDSAVRAHEVARVRIELDHRVDVTERQAEIQSLERQIAVVDGQLEELRLVAERLGNQLADREIRAPIAGKIGQLADLRPGSVVENGDWVATVLPHGAVKVVAFFDPAAALGRIQAGQDAKVRLEGFPWTQFGSLPATVARVGREAHQGRIQVELEPDMDAEIRVPLQHGLPGEVSVRVDSSTPAELVLRAAGHLLSESRPAS